MSPRPFQILIIAVPIAIFGWLGWQFLVPTGTFRVSWEPGERSAFVDPLRPDQRVQAPTPLAQPGRAFPPWQGGNLAAQAVVGDPVYTFVHPLRRFDAVTVNVWFKDAGVPIVEAGALTKPGPDEQYDLQPLENTLIDDSPWHRLDADGLVLLQRTPTYASIADFLAHPPAGSRMAQYRYDGLLPAGASRLLPSLDLDAAGIDFVIARYATPRTVDGWTVATFTVNPKTALRQNGAWKIVLSVPGVANPPLPPISFVIHRMDVTMTRPNLADTLKTLLHV